MKLLSFILLFALSGCSSHTKEVSVEGYGKKFSHNLKNNKVYSGNILGRGASDYYWITEYEEGLPVIEKHYFVSHENREHKLLFTTKPRELN